MFVDLFNHLPVSPSILIKEVEDKTQKLISLSLLKIHPYVENQDFYNKIKGNLQKNRNPKAHMMSRA